MEGFSNILDKVYQMTAISSIVEEPSFLVMYLIAFGLLYLGIVKKYEPLLLIPIAFGVLIANFPGGDMGVIQADPEGFVLLPDGTRESIWDMPLHKIAHDLGLMNYLYYALIKTGLLPPVIFLGVGALTDFGPMLRNLKLAIFGAAAQFGIFAVLLVSLLIGFTPQEAADKNWFVIVDGKALNPGIYNDFSRLVKQGVYSILRTMIVDGSEVKFVDIQLLEEPMKQKAGDNEQDAYYRVAVKTAAGIDEQYYTRFSETNETTPRIVSVYEKDGQGLEHETVLFTYSVK